MFSGGSDSALLLYFILKEIQKYPNKNITSFVIDRPNGPLLHAKRIYDLIQQRFNLTNSNFEVLDIPVIESQKQLRYASDLIVEQKGIDIVFWAVNKYPSDESIRPKINVCKFQETEKIKYPFANYTKDILIKFFYDYGLTDILFQTHSCGHKTNGYCAECFNCRERAWAYQQLGMSIEYGI